MKLRDIKELLDARVLGEFSDLEREYTIGGAADLMSDVLAFVSDDCVLLTGLTNEQVVRTAEMVDVGALIFVRGKVPSPEVCRLADERRITLLSTNLTMFVSAGKLFGAGIKGFAIEEERGNAVER